MIQKKNIAAARTKLSLYLMIGVLLITGCSVNKYLDAGEKLYDGTEITFQDGVHFVNESSLRSSLEELSQPKTNSKLPLWIHYKYGNPNKKRGVGNFLKKRFGQDPVFYQQSDTERNALVLEKYMIDQGYFNADVSYDTTDSPHAVAASYHINAPGRHRIRNIEFPQDTLSITHVIKDIHKQTYLKTKEYYTLSKLENERSRIAIEARNRGYFDFSADRIFYFVDTNAVKKPDSLASDIWLQVKKPASSADYKQYHIGTTYIYPNFDLANESTSSNLDSTIYKDLVIFQNRKTIKPSTLDASIAQKKGDLFSEERQIATTNHLLDLGIYKFVNLKYRGRESNDSSYLDRYVYLTPGKVQDIGAELEATTRQDAYGMSVKGSYSHKNVFGGAERLDLSLSTGFENGGMIAISDDTVSNNLTEVTAKAELSFPRFIVPFVQVRNNSSFHTPRTKINAIANFQQRKELFSLSSYKFTYGYDWDETRRKRHQLDLLSVNFVQIYNRTPTFENYLSENPLLANSFTNLFVLGTKYTYTLTNQELNRPKNYFFFLGKLTTSGNTAYLLSTAFNKNAGTPYQLFNRAFSQFTKVDFDYRYNWLGKKGSVVTKFSGGIGVPYSNSISLPYSEQYFSGGANSMRGFPIRSLLGTYSSSSSEIAQSSFDQIGDLKLEWNLEYRFDLLSQLFLKGAFFLDVGNVWNLKSNVLDIPDTKIFKADRFISDLAVASGFGIRLDIQYFVVRLDLGLPIRKPYLVGSDRWAFNKITKSGWIKDNMAYNIALGYPF